jgi:cytochrome c biogenesis protein CcdA
MVEVSFLATFLGGVLSLLSPCSALLLPAFFAYAFTSKTQLFGRTGLFLAGLCTVFIPLGLGVSFVGAALLENRDTTSVVAGLMLIGFGILQAVGHGFTLLPQRFAGQLRLGSTGVSVYATGLVYGLAGFCSGPLLGSALTIAGSSGSPILGAALLFTYALGTAAPVFIIAWLWDRYDLGHRRWLRGTGVRIGPISTHSTNLLGGTLLMALGLSFILLQGSSALSGWYADLGLEEIDYRAQVWIAEHLSGGLDLVWVIGLGVVVCTLALWRVRVRLATHHPAPKSDARFGQS